MPLGAGLQLSHDCLTELATCATYTDIHDQTFRYVQLERSDVMVTEETRKNARFRTPRTGRCVLETLMAQPKLKLVQVDQAGDDAAHCRALGQILESIGDKWTILVVGVLSRGSMRFNEIQRAIPGVSHKMLTTTLRGLERDGLVKRTPFATIPPRVDYELTEQGHSLSEPLLTLGAWARLQQPYIENSRKKFDDGKVH